MVGIRLLSSSWQPDAHWPWLHLLVSMRHILELTTQTGTHVHARAHMPTSVHTRACMHTHTYTHVCMHTHAHFECAHVCMRVCVCEWGEAVTTIGAAAVRRKMDTNCKVVPMALTHFATLETVAVTTAPGLQPYLTWHNGNATPGAIEDKPNSAAAIVRIHSTF